MNNLQLYKSHLDIYNQKSLDGLGVKEKKELSEKFTSDMITESGHKSGKFAELCLQESTSDVKLTFKKADKIIPDCQTTKKKHFRPDGYIEELDMYVESKMYTFWATGTANEKLWGFLSKLNYYDKPCILVFAGEHECLKHDECNSIWQIYHNNSAFDDHVYAEAVKKVRNSGKLHLTKLSEYSDYITKLLGGNNE